MDRQKLIERIKALRALSTSSNLEEAATAARIAETLIQKHALEEVEFELSSGVKEEAHKDEIPIVQWNQKQNVWQNVLLTHLCKAYDCDAVMHHQNGKLGYYAIGRASDIGTIRYQFAFFHLELTRLAKRLAPDNLGRGEGKTWFNSFYLGAVNSIGESLRKTKQEVRQEASSNALVVIDQRAEEAASLKRKLYPKAATVSYKSNLNTDAWTIGKEMGNAINNRSPGLSAGFRGLLGK
jgi:uncharacterized protein DUF2786